MFRTLPALWPWQDNGAAAAMWTPKDYLVLVLFGLWWPGLYIMYTHMIRQRRRALGSSAKPSKEAQRLAKQRQQGLQAIADGTWATGESPKPDSKKSK